MLNAKNKVSCKTVLGQTVCKVGSTVIVPKNPVSVTIYTSRDCGWCDKEINTLKKKLGKLHGLARPIVKYVEDSRIDIDSLGVFPVVDFGAGVIERGTISKLEGSDIVNRVIASAKNNEIMRSYQ